MYADYLVDRETGETTTVKTYQPGIGEFDWQTTALSYFHADQIGSIRVATDESGEIVARIACTAFGEQMSAWVIEDAVTRYRYAGAWGYQTDSNWGDSPGAGVPFVHVGHRWYDPRTGRFLQRDPISIFGGMNVYGYVGNAPLGLVDPDGLGFWDGDNWFHEWIARNLWMNVHDTNTLANMSDARAYTEAIGGSVAIGAGGGIIRPTS